MQGQATLQGNLCATGTSFDLHGLLAMLDAGRAVLSLREIFQIVVAELEGTARRQQIGGPPVKWRVCLACAC